MIKIESGRFVGPELGRARREVTGRARLGGADSGGFGAGFGRLVAERAAEGDATLGQVVRRDGDRHDVTGQDADEVLADLAGDGGDDLVAVVETNPKLRVGQGL